MTGTDRKVDTPMARGDSRPVRYRFTDAAGKTYVPLRLKPSVTVSQIIQQAFPGDAQDTDWSLEKA